MNTVELKSKTEYDNYLLVINPPYPLYQRIRGVKEILSRYIGHAKYINSPAHITVGAFRMKRENKPSLFNSLFSEAKKQKCFTISLNGIKGFESNRLLFLDVNKDDLFKTHENVLNVIQPLIEDRGDNYLNRFSMPHITICVAKNSSQFDAAYAYLSELDFTGSFNAKSITVLSKPSDEPLRRWHKVAEVPLG